jgi:hypothetical protein
MSARLAKVKTPLNVTGWYLPAEVDPSWSRAKELPALLAKLPRPLWISFYDGANIGPDATADWLKSWLPSDIGVFFQDGVGVYNRTAPVARNYADALSKRLGKKRVKIIVEAFRPKVGGGFRSATTIELKPQIAAYDGYSLYLFDGPALFDPGVGGGVESVAPTLRLPQLATIYVTFAADRMHVKPDTTRLRLQEKRYTVTATVITLKEWNKLGGYTAPAVQKEIG